MVHDFDDDADESSVDLMVHDLDEDALECCVNCTYAIRMKVRLKVSYCSGA